MKREDMKDGMVVRLTREIVNPRPDKRFNDDWTREPTFRPGRYLIGLHRMLSDDLVPEITKEGSRYRSLRRIVPTHPAFDAFLAACEPAEESLQSILDLALVSPHDILGVLVRSKVTLADVKDALATVNREWEEEADRREARALALANGGKP